MFQNEKQSEDHADSHCAKCDRAKAVLWEVVRTLESTQKNVKSKPLEELQLKLLEELEKC